MNSMNETPTPIRLIIADDNAATRAATIALLETGTHQLTIWEAANGEEVVLLAENVQPDVILMDVQMPGLDGIAATQHIKRRWPAIKIVVLTMYMTYQAAALAAGADAFLLKGGSADGLITAVFQ